MVEGRSDIETKTAIEQVYFRSLRVRGDPLGIIYNDR